VAESIRYRLLPYSTDALAEALSNQWVDAAATSAKYHFRYFCEYLGHGADGLAARTILFEEPYYSQSFLDDYADYYARGFASYDRLCKRVHFFGDAVTAAELDAALTDPASEQPWDSYLGYIVVKPLPARQIGATLLRPYAPNAGKRRHYPVVRTYEVNLLGKRLMVDTLIFQEQDNNVSACATTALWMAFHKTAFMFQTALPSPYQITAGTRNFFHISGRTFPNGGLDQTQIGDAIQAVGLVAELRTYPQPDEWNEGWSAGEIHQKMTLQQSEAKGFLYAYLRLGLPVLLFLLLDGETEQGHLVTVTGYRTTPHPVLHSPHISLTSDTVDRLYAHDDQMGPFARFSFTSDGRLLTPWPTEDPNGRDWAHPRTAALYSLFVPVVAEIRITYEQVYRQVGLFEQIFTSTIEAREDVVWDIYLDRSVTYKEELRDLQPVEGPVLREILTRFLPKYVWVARASLQQVPILEMVFDATDLHTGFYCLLINVFDPLRPSLQYWLSKSAFRRKLIGAHGFDERFLTLLLQSLQIPTRKGG
jgi:hypothetical protein